MANENETYPAKPWYNSGEGCDHCKGPKSYDQLCLEHAPNSPLQCTRLKGHYGKHVACGGTIHALAVWPQNDDNAKAEG